MSLDTEEKSQNSKNVKSKRVWEKVYDFITLLDRKIKTGELVLEEKLLLKSKIQAYFEIYRFIELYPLWSKTPKSAEEKLKLWLNQSSRKTTISKKEKTAIRVSNYRLNEEITQKIGVTTLDAINNCKSLDELKEIMDKFRNCSGIRNLKKSYLIDLLAFCQSGLTPKSSNQHYLVELFSKLVPNNQGIPLVKLFYLYQVNQDRFSNQYGQEDKVKKSLLEGVLYDIDEKFRTVQEAFELFFKEGLEFEIVLAAVETTLKELEEGQ